MKNFFCKLFGFIKKILLILIIAIIIIFSLGNPQVVSVSLSPFSYEVETRLFIVILFCFFAGLIIGYLLVSISLTKEKFKNLMHGIKIKKLEKQTEEFKATEEINKIDV